MTVGGRAERRLPAPPPDHSLDVVGRNHPDAGVAGRHARSDRSGAGRALHQKRFRSLSEVARLITGCRWSGLRFFGLRKELAENANVASNRATVERCAVYPRKSSEEGLERDFNSLQAQREACEAFIKSQGGEGWQRIQTAYDDGGFSGAPRSARHCRNFSRTSASGGSIPSSFIRSTG